MDTTFQNRVRSTGSLLSRRQFQWRRCSSAFTSLIFGVLLCFGYPADSVSQAEVIDRLVAVVNRQIITLGDLEQEQRLQGLDAFPAEPTGKSSAEQRITQDVVLQRLIEQILIREQIQQFPGLEIEDALVESQLASVQKKLGGAEKLGDLNVETAAVKDRLRWQLQVMKFIDYRFRQFVMVDTKEIEAYYQNQFLPELQKRNSLPAPQLADVEDKIRKIVTEEKLNIQVEEWLASLRKDASIEIFH